jgi:hypothetical protein
VAARSATNSARCGQDTVTGPASARTERSKRGNPERDSPQPESGEFASNFTKTSGPRLKIFDGHPQLDRSLGAFTKSCLVPRYRSVV